MSRLTYIVFASVVLIVVILINLDYLHDRQGSRSWSSGGSSGWGSGSGSGHGWSSGGGHK